jgi:hypothetical protein
VLRAMGAALLYLLGVAWASDQAGPAFPPKLVILGRDDRVRELRFVCLYVRRLDQDSVEKIRVLRTNRTIP